MNKESFVNNRKKLANELEDNSILVMFAGKAPYKSADEVYPFTPNRNFYYLTGVDRENIILMVTKRKGKVNETLFIEESDPVLARWVGEKMKEDEAKEASGIANIDYTKNFNDAFGGLLSRYEFNNLYLDLERQEWNIPMTEAQRFAAEVRNKYSYFNIKNAYYKISELRTIKSKEEIDNIRIAIDITNQGIEAMMKNSKAGIMEYELEAHFDYVLTSKRIKDKAFKTIAAAGKNATILHYSENNNRCEDNALILFDLGAQYSYYNADISRTFPVNGRFTERQKQIYNVVLRANEEVMKAVKPGLPFVELNEIAKKVLAEGCKELGLINEDSELSKYYFHGVAHYLGLDTHDVGDREEVLKPGMIFTNEPGLYIPEEGIGIRIEDDILVTEDGYENLSKDIIKTVEEIENFMSKR